MKLIILTAIVQNIGECKTNPFNVISITEDAVFTDKLIHMVLDFCSNKTSLYGHTFLNCGEDEFNDLSYFGKEYQIHTGNINP